MGSKDVAKLIKLLEAQRPCWTMTKTTKAEQSQTDKFKEAARELGCDEDEARWDERLRKVTRQNIDGSLKKPA